MGKNREEAKANRTMNKGKWKCNRNNHKEEYNGVTKRIKEEVETLTQENGNKKWRNKRKWCENNPKNTQENRDLQRMQQKEME